MLTGVFGYKDINGIFGSGCPQTKPGQDRTIKRMSGAGMLTTKSKMSHDKFGYSTNQIVKM